MHRKIFALILIDQITKLIFWSRDFFIGPVHIHSVKNPGLVFSLSLGAAGNLILIIAALVFFVYYYFQHRREISWWGHWVFALVLAGAVSNLADRLYLGYVRDFLDIGLGFTFNLADAFIVVGVLAILTVVSKPVVEDYR